MPKVSTLEKVLGFREYRFVPVGWESPFLHHVWCEIDDPETVTRCRIRFARFAGLVRWYFRDGKIYEARIDYHPTERPVLVLVGGIQ